MLTYSMLIALHRVYSLMSSIDNLILDNWNKKFAFKPNCTKYKLITLTRPLLKGQKWYFLKCGRGQDQEKSGWVDGFPAPPYLYCNISVLLSAVSDGSPKEQYYDMFFFFSAVKVSLTVDEANYRCPIKYLPRSSDPLSLSSIASIGPSTFYVQDT